MGLQQQQVLKILRRRRCRIRLTLGNMIIKNQLTYCKFGQRRYVSVTTHKRLIRQSIIDLSNLPDRPTEQKRSSKGDVHNFVYHRRMPVLPISCALSGPITEHVIDRYPVTQRIWRVSSRTILQALKIRLTHFQRIQRICYYKCSALPKGRIMCSIA